jgi:hypothetical protein
MKIRTGLAAAAGAMMASMASADVVLNIGNANLAGGQQVTQFPQLSGTLLGFVISFDFEPDAAAQANGSWASDASLVIQSPITNPVQWGGYDLLMGGPSTVYVSDWSFIGATEPGPYTDIRGDVPIGMFGTGMWGIAFGNGWSDSTPVQYNSVTLTLFGLQPVPSPGSAALLGLGGVVMTHRRRRA